MPLVSTGYDDFLPQAGPADSGNIPLDLQARRLATRKQALVDQAKQYAATNAALGPQTISGGPRMTDIYVPPPRQAAFLPIAQQVATGLQQRLLDEDSSAYDKTVSAAALQHLKAKPADDADEPTKLAWAQQGSQIPSLKPVMDAYLSDQVIKAPERAEARAERVQTRADALAEAQRKQRDELEYRRQRDADAARDRQQRQDDQQSFLMAMKGMSGGRGGSASSGGTWGRDGVNAADIIRDVDADGNITLTDKISGEQKFFKGGGREAAGVTKERQDAKQQVDNAEKALDLLDQMKPLIPKATSSGFGAARDKLLSYPGISTKAGDAAGEIDQMGKKLVNYIDRKGLGPQFSDSDLKFLRETSGGLGDPNTPVSRKLAVYERVRKQFEDQARGASPKAADDADRRDKIREAVKQANSPSVDDLVNKYAPR